MKKVVYGILFVLIVAGGFALTSPSVQAQIQQKLSYNQCDTPIQYRLGFVDDQFGLTESQALADLKTATNIWSKAEGRQLFEYNANANLVVNFKYDQRSALSSQINQLKNKVDSQDNSLQQQISQYNADVKTFEDKLSALNATIQKYNSEGGAPPDVYNDLVKQQNELRGEGDALNNRARQLNLNTRDYNSNIDSLNHDINQYNVAITQKPEEGLFDPNADEITIYFAVDPDEVIHTITHEFGHSLGMPHISDPKGIMYPFSTPSITLSSQDKEELDFACREQSLPQLWLIHFSQEVQFFSQLVTKK